MKNILFVLIVVISSCQFSKKEYYKTGELKSVEYKLNNTSSQSRKVIYYRTGEVKDSLKYDSLGNLSGKIYSYNKERNYCKWTEYVDNKPNGIKLVHCKDGSRITQRLSDGKLHGIENQISPDGVERQVLWLNDKPVFAKFKKKVNKGDTLRTVVFTKEGAKEFDIVSRDRYKVESIFKLDNNEKICIGSLDIDEKGIVKESVNNSYVQVFCNEEYHINDSVNIRLEGFFGNLNKINLQVELCDINGSVYNVSKIDVYRSKTDDLKVSFNIKNPIIGYNLLLGKVKVLRGKDQLFETYFFEDFTVIN